MRIDLFSRRRPLTNIRLDDFREATWKFYCGELDVKEYKRISGKFGSYAQKGGQSSMVRLRMAGGEITKDRLKFIVDCIDKYDIDLVHQTTCQSIQLHNLKGEQVCKIIEEAAKHGIITLGGGGDFPRNVTASPLSGVEIGECFDVLPYAKAAERYVLGILDDLKLPRKLKIGFSNSEKNEVHATFRDLGFMAKSNGKFDVYSAGGLGNNPRMGICVALDVEPSNVLYYVKAMIYTFVRYGNYENRSKARTRYMQETLGEEGYREAYLGELEKVISEGGLEIHVPSKVISKKGKVCPVPMSRIHPQKQEGLYYVTYHAIGGDPVPMRFKQIYDVINDMPDVEIRTSTEQTLYIINCNSEEARKIVDITYDGAVNLFETSVSCIGSTICQQGLRDSNGLLHQLIEMSRRNNFADGILPRVQISGCTSSCASHQIGTIGFQGTSVKDPTGASVPAFFVFVNGSHIARSERFGDSIGKMPESKIPIFLEKIGRAVAISRTDFRSWYVSDNRRFLDIANEFLVKE